MGAKKALAALTVPALFLLAFSPALAARRPDLVEIQVSKPPAAKVQGTKFNVTDTVKNKGNARAGSSTTRYLLSKDQSKSSGDKKLGERNVPGLSPDSSSQGNKRVTIPLNTQVGKYFVLACADAKTDVRESNEGNNCKSSSTKLNVTPADTTAPAAPTITSTSPSSPSFSTTVFVRGTAEAGTVNVYKSNDCSGGVADSVPSDDFDDPGGEITVAENTTTTFTANVTDAAGNTSACSTSVNFTHDNVAPPTPTITGSDPASPSNNNNPKIIGTAEAGSTVTLFQSNDCSSGVTTGSAATFASPGIAVLVDPNTNNSFTVSAADAAENTSPCSTPFPYVEDSTAPAAPSSLGFSPPSPANENSPELVGSAEAGSTIKVYRVESAGTSCPTNAQLVATGPQSQFPVTGFTVNVPDNSSTVFRVTATDAAGNQSACSALATYVEDSVLFSESEPNDTSGTADPLTGVTPHINSRITTAADVDYYSVVVPAGGNLRLETTGPFGSISSCPGTTMTLYNTDGTSVLATNSAVCSVIDGAGGINTPNPNAGANNLAGGTYFIKVEDTGNNNSIDAYRLRGAIGNPFPSSELEPNNTTPEADTQGVLFNGDDIRGGNLPIGDVDIYKVNLASASVVRLELFDGSGTDCRPTTTWNMKISTLDSAGALLNSDQTISGIQVCSAVVSELPAGVSYVKVEEANNDLLVSQYRLQFKVLNSVGIEAESNDTIGTANALAGSNIVVSGDHEVITDKDVYAVTVAAGQSIRAEIIEGNGNLVENCGSGGGIDSKITLTNAAGDVLAFDGDDGRSSCSMMDGTGSLPLDWGAHNLAAGTYYLRVESWEGAAISSQTFDYRLAVTVI